MKNKNILCFILLIAVLFLTSCTSEHAFENEDYKKIKEEYKKFEEVISRYGYLKEDLNNDRFIIDKNNCPHQFGYGYIKDGNTHTYVCRKCQGIIKEAEPHSDIKIIYMGNKSNIHIYAKHCPVCERESIDYSSFFEYIITKKNPEEFELFYGVKLNG